MPSWARNACSIIPFFTRLWLLCVVIVAAIDLCELTELPFFERSISELRASNIHMRTLLREFARFFWAGPTSMYWVAQIVHTLVEYNGLCIIGLPFNTH